MVTRTGAIPYTFLRVLQGMSLGKRFCGLVLAGLELPPCWELHWRAKRSLGQLTPIWRTTSVTQTVDANPQSTNLPGSGQSAFG